MSDVFVSRLGVREGGKEGERKQGRGREGNNDLSRNTLTIYLCLF